MKRKILVRVMITAVVALVAGSVASSKTPRPVKFSAALNVGQEKPHPKGTKLGASGRFTATLTGTSLAPCQREEGGGLLRWASSGCEQPGHVHDRDPRDEPPYRMG